MIKRSKPRRKSSGQRLKERADKLVWHQVLERDGGKCVRCGKDRGLGPSHVFPKGKYPRLRWLLDNILTMCWLPCHSEWWHKSPIEATEWFAKTYPERLTVLRTIKDTAPKVDMRELIAQLEDDCD